MIRIVGKYGHLCVFNDYKLTDEHSEWFVYCRCFQPSAEFLELQDKQAIKLDFKRKPKIDILPVVYGGDSCFTESNGDRKS